MSLIRRSLPSITAYAAEEARRAARPVTGDDARRRAYGLLGDAADWMRGLPHANTAQARAVARFFKAIDAAKAALNDAANAADRPQRRSTR